jgi:hypothetical protein
MLERINTKLMRSFSTGSDSRETIVKMIIRQIILMSGVVIVSLILKPDLFGLIPNSLDPMFYTGYSINLDDALAAAGNGHYFVTRWSSYLPQYFLSQIFGPYWGRIALRILMLAIISEVFWRIGKKFRFTTSTRIVSFGLVVLMPMFVRAFTTDYQEYSSTFYGILLISIVLQQKITYKWGVCVGILAALLVVSNPFNLGLIAISGLLWLVKDSRINWNWSTVPKILASLLAAVLTLSSGYALFRFHYRIGNVYRPTLDFIENYRSPAIDLWTAPNRSWVGHFGWIYIPILVVLFSKSFVRLEDRDLRQSKTLLEYLVLIVFVYHVYMQISRGHALETSYYWAMALPPLFVLLFIFLGHLANRLNSPGTLAAIFIAALGAIRFELFGSIQLGANYVLLISIVIFVTGVFAIAHFKQRLLLPLVLIGLFWLQIGSPPYKQLTFGGDSNTPRYDLVYGKQADLSDQVLRETIWFTEQMDKIDEDWKSTFLTASGWSAAIVGTYIPQPFSRWIVPVSSNEPLSPNVRDELEFGRRKYLTIYGDPVEVKRLLPLVQNQLPSSKIQLDETNINDLKYRLVVILGNNENTARSSIPIARLDRNIGSENDDGSVVVTGGTPQGFVSFGPYFSLGAGKYRAILNIDAEEIGNIGVFEVFNDRTGAIDRVQIRTKSTGPSSFEVDFVVNRDDSTWQLRTHYKGLFDVRFIDISLERYTNDEQ